MKDVKLEKSGSESNTVEDWDHKHQATWYKENVGFPLAATFVVPRSCFLIFCIIKVQENYVRPCTSFSLDFCRVSNISAQGTRICGNSIKHFKGISL